MRIFGVFLFVLFRINSLSQELYKIEYLDSAQNITSNSTATYYREYLKVESGFKAITYWQNPQTIYSVKFSHDSINMGRGVYEVEYYQSGEILDSTTFDKSKRILYSIRYYKNGDIHAVYKYNQLTKEETQIGYDNFGEVIPNFTYIKYAEFPGGSELWMEFLSNNIKMKVPKKKGAPVGEYKVVVKFSIDEDGSLIDFVPETNHGYGMEQEVIRVLKKSSKWESAIWMNERAKDYRRQPITFIIVE